MSSSSPKYRGCPPIQLIVRKKDGWLLYSQNPRTGKLTQQTPTKPCGDCDITYSTDGQYFAVINNNAIEIYYSYSGRLLSILPHERCRNVYFSPLNNYIISYHHRRTNDRNGNCWIWKFNHQQIKANKFYGNNNKKKEEEEKKKVSDNFGEIIYQFFLPEFDKKCQPFSFSMDEKIGARVTKNGILIHDLSTLHFSHKNHIIAKLDYSNQVKQVLISPINQPLRNIIYPITIFALPKKNKAGTVTIYDFNIKEKNFMKRCQQSFFSIDQCDLEWNRRGDRLLVTALSDVDHSGKSYYGHQSLYLLNYVNKSCIKIRVSSQGKLQDSKWHPFSKEFLMIDNHPQQLTVFDNKGNKMLDLGTKIRNIIRFSNDGRFLWIGGFGNLNGEMSWFDWRHHKEIGYNKDGACRFYQWSPDSSTFLTARLYPYMTVDNGLKIYKYNGKLLNELKYERLYQCCYRPNLIGVYPDRSPSPNSRGPMPKKSTLKSKYVPPHLRNSTNTQKSMNHNTNINNNNNNNNNNNFNTKQPKKRKRKPRNSNNSNNNMNNNNNISSNMNQPNQPSQRNSNSKNRSNQLNQSNQINHPIVQQQNQPIVHNQYVMQQQQQQQQYGTNDNIYNNNNNNNVNNNNYNNYNNNNYNNYHNNDHSNNNMNDNLNENEDNEDENNPTKKKRRRRGRNKNKNKNSERPGFDEHDNQRWARGKKYQQNQQ